MYKDFNVIKNFIKQSGSPKDMLTNFFMQQNQSQNQQPMLNNLFQLAKNGNSAQIESFARNLCKEYGIDFDKEFPNFIKQFKC